MGPPVSAFLTFLQVLPFVAVPVGVSWPLAALLSVPFPHLFTEFVHGVQVRVVDELHEVSVPDLLARRHAVGHVFGLSTISVVLMKQFFQVLRVDHFQRDFEKRLHEAVFYRMTQVSARILSMETPQQEALLRPDDVVIHSDLAAREGHVRHVLVRESHTI